MNIELNPASALPVSEAAKTFGAQSASGSDFLDAFIKVAKDGLPADDTVQTLEPVMVQIDISALFDRSSGFYNFSGALSKGPQLNFLDIIFSDTSSIGFSVSFTGTTNKENPSSTPFFNLFGI